MIKKILIGLVGLVVLVVVAAVAIPFLIPMETYKTKLVDAVKQATGRQLSLKGPIGFSLLPRLEVTAENVAFANAPGAAPADMVTLKKLQLRLELMPLLRGEIAVGQFVLVEPVIALAVDKAGKPNWAFAPEGGAAAPAANQQQAAKPAQPAQGGSGGKPSDYLSDIKLGDIRIQEGQVSYADARTGKTEKLDKINVKLVLPSLAGPVEIDGDAVWNAKKIDLKVTGGSARDLMAGAPTDIGLSVGAEPVKFALKGNLATQPAPKFEGTIEMTSPSVRNLTAWVGSPLPPGGGLGPLSISGKLGYGGTKATFTGAKFGLDDIKATGDFAVDTGGAKPVLQAKLDVEKLDLNPYLPPEQKPAGTAGGAAPAPAGAAKPAAAPGPDQGWSTDPIDTAGLQAVDADLALKVGGLVYRKIQIGKSALNVALKGGKLTADLAEMALYDGNGKAKFVVDGSAKVPAIAIDFDLQKVKAEPLLRDAAAYDKLSGALATNLSVKGAGPHQKAIVESLAGKGAFTFSDGALKGLNLAAMVRNVTSAFDKNAAEEKTDFSEFGATYTITNGILTNNDLSMKSPLLRLSGAGTVEMPPKTVHYRLEPKAVATLQGQGGGSATGIAVPIIVEGPWSNITYKPDLLGIIKDGLPDPSKIGDSIKNVVKPPAGGAGALPNPADALRGLLKKP